MTSTPDTVGADLSVTGLHQLRSPGSSTSIIFIHGILSSGANAWGVPSWPELLLNDEKHAQLGIFVYTFRSTLASQSYTVDDAASVLLEHFGLNGLFGQKVVFVCHSLGGIVARRFLTKNQQTLQNRRNEFGLFLIASPSLGSADANTVRLLVRLFRHAQASILMFSQDNQWLVSLHSDFKGLLTTHRPPIIGKELTEDKPIKIKRLLGLWSQVVEPFSAAQYFSGDGLDPVKVPDTDHFTIAKPITPGALQYRLLSAFIQQLPSKLAVLGAPHFHDSPNNSLVEETVSSPVPSLSSSTEFSPEQELSILNSAIFEPLVISEEMIETNADHQALAPLLMRLRRGRMLERVLASAIFSRHDRKDALLSQVLMEAESERDCERLLPLLRFDQKRWHADDVSSLLLSKFPLNDAGSIRLRISAEGWLGQGLLPKVDWDDKWCIEKFSLTAAKAALHSCWRPQDESFIRSRARICIEMNAVFESYYHYEISFFDWMSACKGIPAANLRMVLSELSNGNAPKELLLAILVRLQVAPSPSCKETLIKLIRDSDTSVRAAALRALAWIPGRTLDSRKSTLKLLAEDDIAASIFLANNDFFVSDWPALSSSIRVSGEFDAKFIFSWVIAQAEARKPPNDRDLQHQLGESPDKLLRCFHLMLVARSGDKSVASQIDDEEVDARDVECFLLCVARCYLGSPRNLLQFLSGTSESIVYVPYLLAIFQRMFSESLLAINAPTGLIAGFATRPDDI